MGTERPGKASVQYDDVRGEAAGDFSDRLSDGINGAARELGFKGPGRVVGIEVHGPDADMRPGLIDVSFCVFEGDWCPDEINKALAKKNGKLVVKKYLVTDVLATDFLRCFKRLHVNLFDRHIHAQAMQVVDHINSSGVDR